MAKLLITSIGTGMNKDRTTYNEAKYVYLENAKNSHTEKYIYSAITCFENFKKENGDKLVLVGTLGSDWDCLYRALQDKKHKNGVNIEDETSNTLKTLFLQEKKYDINIGDYCKVSRALETIEALLEEEFCESKIILLKYGINENELMENFELLQKIADMVEDGDEIIFDITHSFRSLALFELITVNYIKEVIGKKVEIKKVTYGMFEINREMEGKTPIIDLKSLITTMDCMKAIDEFNRFGTTYALCEILEKNPMGLSGEQRKALSLLNEDVCSNNFEKFQDAVKACQMVLSSKGMKSDSNLKMIANKIYQQIIDQFGGAENDEILLRIELAKWHYDKKRYNIAAVTLREAIISFGCSVYNCDNDNYELRECISYCMGGKSDNYLIKEFAKNWCKFRGIRNGLAHPVNQSNLEGDIKKLGVSINYFKETYNKNFKDSITNKYNRDVMKAMMEEKKKFYKGKL